MCVTPAVLVLALRRRRQPQRRRAAGLRLADRAVSIALLFSFRPVRTRVRTRNCFSEIRTRAGSFLSRHRRTVRVSSSHTQNSNFLAFELISPKPSRSPYLLNFLVLLFPQERSRKNTSGVDIRVNARMRRVRSTNGTLSMCHRTAISRAIFYSTCHINYVYQ